MSFFDDIGSGFESGNTLTSAGSGAAMGFMVGGPIGAGIGAGVGVLAGSLISRQQRKARQAIESQQKQAQEEARQNRNRLVEQNFRKRSRSGGMGSMGELSPGQEASSRQGTSLLSSNMDNAPSLLNNG